MGKAQESGPAQGAHAGVSTEKLTFLTSIGSVLRGTVDVAGKCVSAG